MMPGNNEASDAPEDSAGNATNGAATDINTGAGDAHSENITGKAAEQVDLQTEGVVADADKGNAADDPLGFGNQRMDAEPADEAQEADEPADDADGLEAQLRAAEAKASEHWDRLLRLQAEMENQRKRAQNDVNKARKFALEGIVGDLLPVKDSLEMGLAAAQAADGDPQSIIEGAELTVKMLDQVFEKNNIVEVNPVDEKFDPEYHQAMSMQEVEGKEANTVTGVMQKGYTLNERLVRPALVMVAK